MQCSHHWWNPLHQLRRPLQGYYEPLPRFRVREGVIQLLHPKWCISKVCYAQPEDIHGLAISQLVRQPIQRGSYQRSRNHDPGPSAFQRCEDEAHGEGICCEQNVVLQQLCGIHAQVGEARRAHWNDWRDSQAMWCMFATLSLITSFSGIFTLVFFIFNFQVTVYLQSIN